VIFRNKQKKNNVKIEVFGLDPNHIRQTILEKRQILPAPHTFENTNITLLEVNLENGVLECFEVCRSGSWTVVLFHGDSWWWFLCIASFSFTLRFFIAFNGLYNINPIKNNILTHF